MSTDAAPVTVVVTLVRTPLRLYQRAEEYNAELMREFALLSVGQNQPGHAPVHRRLIELVAALGARYAHAVSAPDAQREQATELGLAELDLVYEAPASSGADAQLLGEMLDEAQEYCRAGELITLAAPEEVLLFQRWYTSQFVLQIEGLPPVPWPGALD